MADSFNPCFSGRYSATEKGKYVVEKLHVSILVLVEGTLQLDLGA